MSDFAGMNLSVQDGRVEVRVGDAQASAPLDELEALIRVLRGVMKGVARLPRRPAQRQPAAPAVAAPAETPAARAAAPPSPPTAKRVPDAAAPERAEEAPARAAKPKPKAAKPKAAKPKAAKPKAAKAPAPKEASPKEAVQGVASAAAPVDKSTPQVSKRQRKSRKRVGDALVEWMRDNPGWHSTETLLQAVIDNKMTDANPRLAVTIALGKQKGKLFDSDDKGHWKLAGVDAGPPPRVRSKRKTRRKNRGKAATKAKGTKRAQPAAMEAPKPAEMPAVIKADKPAEKPAEMPAAMEAPRPASGWTEPADTHGIPKADKRVEKPGRPRRWSEADPEKTKRALSSLLGLGVMADDE